MRRISFAWRFIADGLPGPTPRVEGASLAKDAIRFLALPSPAIEGCYQWEVEEE
jgi:hypothetical protein